MKRFLAILICFVSGYGYCNMAAPATDPGSYTSNVYFGNYVRVLQEKLMLDLRNYSSPGNGKIIVHYELLADSSISKLPIVFVADQLVLETFSFKLNGLELPFEELDSIPNFPENMIPPDSIDAPFFDWYWDDNLSSGLSIKCPIIKGKNEITVEYEVKPFREMWRFIDYYTVYSLGPARNWQGFDHLHLSILYPESWSGWVRFDNKEQISLDGSGVYEHHFEELPGDYLIISSTPTYPMSKIIWTKNIIGSALLLLTAFLTFKTFSKIYNKFRKVHWSIFILLLFIQFIFLFLYLEFIDPAIMDFYICPHCTDYGYSATIVFFVFFPITLFVLAIMLSIDIGLYYLAKRSVMKKNADHSE